MSNKNRKSSTISLFTAGIITTVSITLVLFLLGLTFLVGFTTTGFASYLKENIAISIEVPQDMDKAGVVKMQKELEDNSYIKSVKFISKEEIKKQLIDDLGRDPSEILGYDPAHSFFDVYVKSEYVNADSMKVVEQSLRGKSIVKNIDFSQTDIANSISNLSLIGSILLILAVILILISFILIRSIIQLNIYSKRFLINTMQLVGATNGFIRRPYIISMVFSGIIAAVLANIAITALVYYITSAFPDSMSVVGMDKLVVVYVLVLVFGIFITAFATTSAVNRYLRMTTNKLYRI